MAATARLMTTAVAWIALLQPPDARAEPVEYVYLRIVPTEVRAWREANELRGRLLMRDGEWLPVDA